MYCEVIAIGTEHGLVERILVSGCGEGLEPLEDELSSPVAGQSLSLFGFGRARL